ncbi:hypothetical protein PENCOP_c001G03591 [Penicillium coprophilum]|uniref:Uncharacterized protein n=1 Tax=Penicillium coprophilum TaxID=36646 RepID=A0A1V6V6Y5_9EURO|nr:hypothetical protein PENCOP_c001G03591 [Penicillium coprophilum]
MFLLLLRKLWIRRRRPDTHQSSTSLTTPKEVESQDKESFIPETVTLTPQHDERGQLANQLAALAATWNLNQQRWYLSQNSWNNQSNQKKKKNLSTIFVV